jgi:small subunit ribosomal protein S9
MVVNGLLLGKYFGRQTLEMLVRQPLEATGTVEKYHVVARVRGGGVSGQAGAVRHGIARALLQADASLGLVLRKGGFLTRDPRMKERKKYGQRGARARFQFSKR